MVQSTRAFALGISFGLALLHCSFLVTTEGLSSNGFPESANQDASPGPTVTPRGDPGSLDASSRTSEPEPGAETSSDGGIDARSSDAQLLDTADAGALAPLDAAVDAACAKGLIVCGGACVDPTSDPFNCNGCGRVCHDGLCGAAITNDMRSASATWVLNGTAFYGGEGPSAVMTAANVLYQAGSVNYRNPVAVDTFTAKFEFRMGYGGGSRNDGMGFMFQKTGPAALSGAGESLGMVGLNGYGVELDLLDNGACGDISGDHVGVDSLANCPDAPPMPTSLFSTDLTGVLDLGDASWHQAVIALQANALSVQLDGKASITDVALPGFVPGTPYYFGFAGATGGIAGGPDGGGGYRTEVRDVAIQFPTPRCL